MARQNKPKARSPHLTAVILPLLAIALTFLIRFWFILEMRGNPFSVLSPQMADSWYYHLEALRILDGPFWGTEVFFLRPLYPYLLAFVYALFGKGNVFAVQFLQALLGAASCFLLFDAARRMFNHTAAFIAALGFALCGILVFYTGTLLYVELTVFLSLLFVWLVLVASGRWWRWLLAGLSFGLLTICRPEFLVLLSAVVIILWRTRGKEIATATPHVIAKPPKAAAAIQASPRNDKKLRTSLVPFLIASVLTIASVPVRNTIVSREPVLFAGHSGIAFYFGNNPSNDGTWQPPPELRHTAGFSHDRFKTASRTIDGQQLTWSQASSFWLRKGLGFILGQPGRFLSLLARKFLLFWSDYEVPNNYYPETARASSLALKFAFASFGLVAAFGVLGMVWAWPLRSRAWPAYLFVAAYLLSALVFYVLSRLRAPVLPFLLMFAGYGLTRLIGAIRSRKLARGLLGLALTAAVYAGSVLIPVDRTTYSSQAWTQAANIHLSRKQARPALDAIDQALKANPDNPSARYTRLALLAGMGRLADAETEQRHLTRLAAQDPANRILAAMAAARVAIGRRDFDQAAEYYLQALELDPRNPETLYLLGLVYVSLDSLELARRCLSQAVRLEPFHADASSALQMVESHLKQPD